MRVTIFCLLAVFIGCGTSVRAARLDSLLTVLDRTIDVHQRYVIRHEARIEGLKKELQTAYLPDTVRYRLNFDLFRAYKSYVCDSAIACLNRNIELADRMGYAQGSAESRIALSYHLSSSGMYLEAVDVLHEVCRADLSRDMLIGYYAACDHVYGELGFYTQDRRNGERYEQLAQCYRDSIFQLADPDSELYLSMQETALRDAGRLQDAFGLNDRRLSRVTQDSSSYPSVIYGRALIYRACEDREQYMACLAISAIADIRLAIKDHASLWMLAEALLQEGDLQRAHRYMYFSWNETDFYNARLRTWQSAAGLSLIDNTYQQMLQDRNRELKRNIVCISLLLFLLLLALFYIWKQMKRLSAARRDLLDANAHLKELNEELKQMNLSLQSANRKLTEANAIKEGYIARFIKLCSTYVDRLDAYRRMVSTKITANQVADLLKIARSGSAFDEALEELYANFDSVFLHIFPDFVNRFNDLLREDERIVLRDGTRLTTELRIFALIRLGISDSSQIAEFLHYSPNTIYNYRAKVKNKARVSRDDFEELVMRIS